MPKDISKIETINDRMKFVHSNNFLVISDLQIPFEAPNALEFCLYLKKQFNVSNENCLCVGDEIDAYFGGMYKHSPNALHTPNSEIWDTKERLKAWYYHFPKMKVAISNHGTRWMKKAFEADIPSQIIRDYREIISAPTGWQWQKEWVFKDLKNPFRMIHGVGYSGFNGAINAAIDGGISTVIGHLHAFAGINYLTRSGFKVWGMNAGCLIDIDAYAFEYGKDSRNKPSRGVSVVLDSGKIPIWIPYD